ncbi:MAG: hypothetical protein PVH99_14645 [Desulfobacteraceae bacterium]|jgi:hypothetical protein
MSSLGNIKLQRLFFAGILWLGFATWSYGTSLEEVKSRLQLARENLRISEATEARIALGLEKLKSSGTASPQALKEYEAYLARAHEMVAENRKIVKEMEAAYAKLAPPRQPASSSTTDKEGNITDPRIPNEEELGELASLEREFNESLAAFDEMLLEKWDEILAMSAKKMRDLSEEMGEKEGHSGQEAEGEETSSGEGTTGAQEGTEDTGEGELRSEEGTEAQETAAERGKSESKGEDKGQTMTQKRPTYDGHDDDIVARQLREAAEKETDPELKAKLWKEYEDYKRESRQ